MSAVMIPKINPVHTYGMRGISGFLVSYPCPKPTTPPI